MNEESYRALIDAYNQKVSSCELLAKERAFAYVNSAQESDRTKSKEHLRQAEIWTEARAMFVKHYNQKV